MSYCKNYSRILISDSVDNLRLVVRARCKQWSCDYCSVKNAAMWRAHVLDNVNKLTSEDSMWQFVTITANVSRRNFENTLKNIQSTWRKLTELWRAMARKFGVWQPEYVRVYESHKDGSIHLHALVMRHAVLPLHNFYAGKESRNPPTKNVFTFRKFASGKKYRIKDVCASLGGGFMAQVDDIPVQNAGMVTSYITKYMTKSLQGYDAPSGFRRVQTSQGFSKFGEMSSERVWRDAVSLDYGDYLLDKSHGIMWKDIDKKSMVKKKDFDGGIVYPPMFEKRE